MDKYEYRIRAEEINSLIEQQEYAEAVKIADTIDWRRVRRVEMLRKISELYKINRRYEDSKDILLLAYDQQPQTPIYRKIVYSLCELSIKLEEVVQAVEYYKEFVQVAPKDTGRFILQYRLYEAQDVSLEERIAVLEEYKKRDYREKWAYELAYLYHRIGLATRCVEECDELILWFGEGKYVIKAMELKMLHAPLSLQQQEKYNARFLSEMETYGLEEDEESNTSEEIAPSMPIEIKSINLTKAKTARIPSKKIQEESEAPQAWETKEIPMAEIPVDEEPSYGESNMYAEESAIATEAADETAEETASQEVRMDEEDTDMKIVDSSEDMDIQIKTIDVGDQYSTINLQEALAKDLAKLFAEEDMEQVDATRALPVNTVEIASKIISQQEEPANKTDNADTDDVRAEQDVSTDNLATAEASEGKEEIEETFVEVAASQEDITEENEGDVDDLTMLFPPMDLSLGQEEETAEEPETAETEVYILDEQEAEEDVNEEDKYDTEDSATKELPLEEIRELLKESEPEMTEAEECSEEEKDILSKETKVIPVAKINEMLEEKSEEAETEETEDTEPEAEVEETEDTEPEAEAEVEETEDTEPETEVEETEDTEPEAEVEETEDTEPEAEAEVEETEDTEPETEVEETEDTEPEAEVEETEDTEPESEEEVQSIAEESEDVTEKAEGSLQEAPKTMEPPIYGNNVAMSEEMLEQWKKIAIEAAKQAAIEAAAQAAKEAAAQAAQEAAMEAAKATANVMQAIQPEKDEEENASESVAEEEAEEDKQITGQLSFADIMTEWEKTKKENEEKHIEEMKQRVLEQTGSLYSDVKSISVNEDNLSMISPMLDVFSETEDLANEVEQALIEETEGVSAALTMEASEAKEAAEPEKEQSEETEEVEEIQETEEKQETEETEETEIIQETEEEKEVANENQEPPVDAVTVDVEENQKEEEASNKFNTADINGLEEKLMNSLTNQHYETANLQVEALSAEMSGTDTEINDKAKAEDMTQEKTAANQAEEKTDESAKETNGEARSLTKEEKDLFGFIAQTKELQQNLAIALDAISLVPSTGNVIVTGEVGVGVVDIAKQVTTYLSQVHSHFTGKVSVFNFEDLKSKDVIATLDEHANGAIIIESAGQLSQQALVTITNALKNMSGKDMVMILTDTEANINKLKSEFATLSEYFTVEFNINSLDIDGLVKYGKEYARQLEYSIDAMGVLALYNRIEERQTIDHAVTIDEVKEIVNGAIEKAERKSLSNFMDIVFAKKYDKEALTILREKDFLEDKK